MASRATWAKRVATWRASGRTAVQFCARRDFKSSTLLWWSCQLGPAPASPIRLARVLRSPGRAPSPLVVLEVGRARLLVGAGFDRATLIAVLDVLDAQSRRDAR